MNFLACQATQENSLARGIQGWCKPCQ